MGHTLEQFAAQCHDFIKAEPGPAGRKKVAELLQEVLKDKSFIDKHVDPSVGERVPEVPANLHDSAVSQLRANLPRHGSLSGAAERR